MFSFRVVILILGCLRLTEAATNVLNHGDKLNSNSSDYLVSRNGAVALGFCKQEYGQTWDGKQFGYYLAMWYTEDKSNRSIWLANRDDPIADDSGVLIVDTTGLKITRTGENPIRLFSLQSTSITINSSDTKLVLQDTGNLVLQGTNKVLWQSFDYPTNTFLPGMKLGVSHGARLSLTSWLTRSIPASGSFTLEWDPIGNRLVVQLRERVLWTTGEGFRNIPPLDPLSMNYNFTHVSNPNEQYLYYTLAISQFTPEERRKNARLVLFYDGSLLGSKFVLFDSKTCAGDRTDNGCDRWEGTKCRNKGDKFEIRSVRYPHTDSLNNTLLGNISLSINDCKDLCWKDCNCLGVNAMMDLGCQFLSGPYQEGGLEATSYQVIIRNGSSKFNTARSLLMFRSINIFLFCWMV
ncbi:G-type lectin S-receptor-like serine/threonine-protein kinase CES101 [Hibiscus syriacus]|uniref:G-type lectin S-receptor-like serine/threonine-protein kinase CES101 n=1 Tax=Hibiscus syriacus TaxID=106335 RepID=UPI001923DEBB|nr:G-type lectin S-receptor-like serine/threonine-protein kinase CES101 [Hibiscus syriacus]